MTSRLLVLLAFAVALPAAELAIRDLRLGLATRPSEFDFDLTAPLTTVSGSDAFDGGLSVEGGLRWSFTRPGDSVGLIAGVDLAADALSYDGGDGLTTFWAKAAAGVGWATNDRLTLTGEGLIGYGLSSLSLPATAFAPEYTADGTALSYEARVTGTWQFTRGFNAGLMAGWLISSHDLSGDDADLTLDQGGWYAGLICSWRLNDVPPSLE